MIQLMYGDGMKILYFTATGNSLYVAKNFDAELLSIPKLIKENVYTIEDDEIGIICPVHAYSVPRIVKEYIRKANIKANYVFSILTYGNQDSDSARYMKKLLLSKGITPNYINTLLMVDSYVPLFNIKKELDHLKEKKIDQNLNKIIKDINEKKNYIKKKNFGWTIFSCFMNYIGSGFVRFLPRVFFKVDDKCIRCGTCSRVCPTKNIVQKGSKKPSFGKKCESCFACLHNCPECAIHIKFEKSVKRFRNPNINLDEIVKSNNQTNNE